MLNSPRSFSTVTSMMIGQHPELYGMPELSLFLADTVGELMTDIWSPGYLAGLVRALAQCGFGNQKTESCLTSWQWLFNNRQMKTIEVFDMLQDLIKDKRIVEKSPTYVYDIKNLERLPKDASFIHLVRHPATYKKSLDDYFAFNKLPNSDPNYVLNSWISNQNIIEDFLKDIPDDRKMLLKGEDVVQYPKIHLKKVCKFLGIDDSDYSIEFMMHPEYSPYANKGNKWAEYGNDKYFCMQPALRPSEVKPATLKGLPDEVINLATKYGYGDQNS